MSVLKAKATKARLKYAFKVCQLPVRTDVSREGEKKKKYRGKTRKLQSSAGKLNIVSYL